jgi:hypothetical protein
MEDASGMDLDWFWRGWFYSTDAVDISLDSISWKRVDMANNPVPKEMSYPNKIEKPFETLSKKRNRESIQQFPIEKDTALQDFYTFYEPWETADSMQQTTFYKFDQIYTQEEKEKLYENKHYYELNFSNKGGLVTPIILEWTYMDGSKEEERIPVEIWRQNEKKFNQVFVKEKQIKSVRLDPWRETADIDEKNNTAPVPETPKLFMVYKKDRYEAGPNMMQKAQKRKFNKP